MRRFAWTAVLATAPLLVGVSSCAGPAPDARPTIVAAFYPLQYAAEQVVGDAADVVVLTPPGVEPHDIELSPRQAAEVADADLVLYIPGFQPALDAAVEGRTNAVDVTAGIDMIEGDPHIWLDPLDMITIGQTIASRFPGSSTTQLEAAMRELNAEWLAGTAACERRTLVVSHDAFAYLARAYEFTQVGIAGLSPDAEPSPERLAEITELVRDEGVTTIYYETLVDPKVAETIAAETGAETAVLDPIEGVAEGSADTYPTLMRANLDTIRTGEACR